MPLFISEIRIEFLAKPISIGDLSGAVELQVLLSLVQRGAFRPVRDPDEPVICADPV